MKKIFYLLLIMPLLLGACKKEKTEQPTATPSIIGQWFTAKVVTAIYRNNAAEASNTSTVEDFNDANWYRFETGGTFTSSGNPGYGEAGDYVYNAATNKLTILFRQQNVVATVRELTSAKLVVFIDIMEGKERVVSETTFVRTK